MAQRHFLLAVVLGGLPLSCLAQHSVSVPMEIEHSSNPALTADDPVGVTRYRVSPQYTIENQQGPNLTRFSFGGVLERSSNTAISDNRADPNVSLAVERALPVGALGLRASVSESSTREEEFTESGRVTSDSTQRNILLDGTWTRELSEVARLEVGLGLAKVRYDTPSFVGYREARTSLGIGYDVMEDSELSATFATARLSPDRDLARSSLRSFSVGLSTRLSESLRLVAEAGTVRASGLRSASDPSLAFRVDYEGERLTTGLEFARTTIASGSSGGYSGARTVGWTAEYPLSERTTVNLSASRARSLEPGSAVGISLAIGVRQALSEFWSVSGRLGRLESRPTGAGAARSTVAGLILTYSHPDF